MVVEFRMQDYLVIWFQSSNSWKESLAHLDRQTVGG